MTNIEEEFYNTFEIEPTYSDECQIADAYYAMQIDLNKRGILYDDYMKGECPQKNTFCYDDCPYAYNKEQYTPITDRILLELICILNSTNGINCTAYESKNIKDLEKEILNECIEIADDKELKQQVQALFRGEE